MPHETALIATIAAGLGAAFVLGLVAARLRLPPVVGYLVAGIIVGPFSPGPAVDPSMASQLAELGVILLMFGVGLHFSVRDLLTVKSTVVPGALAQIAVTGTVGTLLGHAWGWSWGGAVVLGLSVAVASTVVLLKGLEARDRLDSPEGRMAVGWLVVEDVAMVVALVLLPALAPVLGGRADPSASGNVFVAVGLAIVKVALFVGLMFFVGRRAVPWLLEHVARLGSRELFTLAVLVTALGVGSLASHVFGVSVALGAFFAGAVIAESELAHRAAAEALPMQDAFAVLFFVSVGILFDPRVLIGQPERVLAVLAVIILCKSAVAYALVRIMRHPPRIALTIGASLAQIGEFSFIVAALGVSLGFIGQREQALVVAAALLSITANGPLFSLVSRIAQRQADRAAADPVEVQRTARLSRAIAAVGAEMPPEVRATRTMRVSLTEDWMEDPFDLSALQEHVILVGYGRVGATIAEALERAGVRVVVVEEQERIVGSLRRKGENAIHGDATRPDVLRRAGIERARLIIVTAPEPIRARRVVEVAREANAQIGVAVRTHSATEQAYFEEALGQAGAMGRAVYAEREVAFSLAHYALVALGRGDDEADWVIGSLRGLPTRPTETFQALQTQEIRAFTRSSGHGPPAGADKK
jgi:monovalent cation:H+ antiporter-2, CPA2 family